MDGEDFLKRYARKQRKFPWINLQNADLTDAQIPQVNFSRADLTEAILIRVDLSQSNLVKANLRDANLQEANLTGVDFYKADLTGTILEGANLTGANLTGVNLDEVYLNGATMPDGLPYEEWMLQAAPCLNPALETFQTEEPEPEISEPESQSQFARRNPEPLPAYVDNRPAPPDLSHLKLSDSAFQAELPRTPLIFLAVGYVMLGMILITVRSHFFFWLLAWGGSLLWYLDDSLIWFVPMSGAIAILGSISVNLITFLLAGINFILLLSGLMTMGYKKRKALLDAIWGTGLFTIALLFVSFLLIGNPEGDSYSIFFNTLAIPLALVLALVCATVGANVWLPMELKGFTKQQTLKVFAMITGVSLMSGALFELLF